MEKKTLAGEIEEHHGTTEHTSAQCGLCDLLFQRHLLHPCGGGVRLLQERYGFAYGMTGSLLSLLSIGNLLAGFLIGVLPVASSGAILMPWIIGIIAKKVSLAAGMASNIVPCVGLVIFTLLVARLPEE